jgi:L-alanine-DL-glutamate epimerase-like enolase superfamily enzyme
MSRIKKIEFEEISRPLKTTFATSLGSKDAIASMIINVWLDDRSDEKFVGEVPTSFSFKLETIPAIRQTLEAAARRFIGMPIDEYETQIPILRREYPQMSMTISGLEVAIFRAWLGAKGMKEHQFWGGVSRRLETDITIPFLTDFDKLGRWIDQSIGQGFKIYKIKVGGDLERDGQLLSFVYSYLKDHQQAFEVRLDGNQGYTAESFLKMTDWLASRNMKIQFFEQPLLKDDWQGMAAVRSRSPMPIVLDETIFNHDNLDRVVEGNLADGINIKFAKSGVSESGRMIRTARKHHLKLMIGSMMETMVGLSAAVYCAAGTGAFDYLDLDAIHFLYYDELYETIRIHGPEYIIEEQGR